MSTGNIPSNAPPSAYLEMLGSRGGRVCQVWIAERTCYDAPPAPDRWADAADVVSHPLFSTLPAGDRECIVLLANRAAVRPWEARQ